MKQEIKIIDNGVFCEDGRSAAYITCRYLDDYFTIEMLVFIGHTNPHTDEQIKSLDSLEKWVEYVDCTIKNEDLYFSMNNKNWHRHKDILPNLFISNIVTPFTHMNFDDYFFYLNKIKQISSDYKDAYIKELMEKNNAA